MDYERIKLEYIHEDKIALLTMINTKSLNALSGRTLDEISHAIDTVKNKKECLGLILTGEGKAFAAGADIAEMKDYKQEEGRAYAKKAQDIFNKIESLEKPVIAAVNGYALGGGCELSMSCDIRLVSEKAVFGQPEVNLGLMACFGGTQRLPRLIGLGRAKELFFTARNVRAEEAVAIGLANQVYPADQLLDESISMMKTIVSKAPIGLALTKVAVNASPNVDLISGLELEKTLAALTFASEDKEIGIDAFLNKGTPTFKNN